MAARRSDKPAAAEAAAIADAPKRRGRPKGSRNASKVEPEAQLEFAAYAAKMASLREEQADINERKSQTRKGLGPVERQKAAQIVDRLAVQVDSEKLSPAEAQAVVDHVVTMWTEHADRRGYPLGPQIMAGPEAAPPSTEMPVGDAGWLPSESSPPGLEGHA